MTYEAYRSAGELLGRLLENLKTEDITMSFLQGTVIYRWRYRTAALGPSSEYQHQRVIPLKELEDLQVEEFASYLSRIWLEERERVTGS